MDLTTKFCSKPFEHFEVWEQGQATICCYAWLPYYVGHLDENTSVDDVFNSKVAQDIRKSILDGSFKFCNHQLCSAIQTGTLPERDQIQDPKLQDIIANDIVDNLKPALYRLCYDESCNLSCPSCRIQDISFVAGPAYEQRLKIQQQIVADVFGAPHQRACTVSITGSGDPFGSKLFRELLFSLDGRDFPNVKIDLQTNGVMFTPKYWEKLAKIQNNVTDVLVSLDAATPETYQVTRRGGDWDILQSNLKFLSKLRRTNKIKFLRLDFVVQQRNYQEMPLLIKLGKELEVDTVYFQLVVNSGSWSHSEYIQHAIWKHTHPEFDQFLEVLKDPIFDDSIVDLGNMVAYRNVSRQLASSSEGADTQREDSIDITIDLPQKDSTAADTLIVAGWAFSSKGNILRVEGLIGENLHANLQYGLPRPDVADHFKRPDMIHCGFRGTLDLRDITPKPQILTIRVMDGQGNISQQKVPFTVGQQPQTANGKQTDAITMFLESPQPNSAAIDRCEVAGWAVGHQSQVVWAGIVSGNQVLCELDYGLPRPDVAAHFKRADFTHSGFNGILDLRPYQPLPEPIALRIIDQQGNVVSHQIPIESGQNPPEQAGFLKWIKTVLGKQRP